MKKEVMIGRLTSRRRILIDFIICIPSFYCLYWLHYSMFSKSNFYLAYPEYLDLTFYCLICGVLIAMILATMSYGNKQIIVVDQTNFKYCSNPGIVSRYQQFFRILTNKKPVFDIIIPLDQIEEIVLSYSDIYMLWNQKGHSFIFNLKLLDGTMISINPDNLYFKKENCLAGIEFIENQGVIVKDPYNLKAALRNTEMRFAEHIEKEKNNHGF